MTPASLPALAMHVCADIANAGPERRWPRSHAAPDTVERAVRICAALGIEDQITLAGEQATVAAFTGSLADAAEVLVLASCSEDQTMIDRLQSEFVVRLEDLVTSHPARGTLAELREALEADTPDCERPVVWSNAEERWPLTTSAWDAFTAARPEAITGAHPRASCICLFTRRS